MPRRYHRQATFNEDEMEKIKKVQGVRTDDRFMRDAVFEYVRESERTAVEAGSAGRPERAEVVGPNRLIGKNRVDISIEDAVSDSDDPFE